MSDIIQYLQDNGWKEFPDQFRKTTRCFAKRYDTPTRCHCNDDKAGIQVVLGISVWTDGRDSIEMDICGELSDGTWVELKNYVLPQDIESVINLIPRMLSIWEAANQTTTTES